MEVVDGQEHVRVERRAFESQHWTVVALGLIEELNDALIFLFGLFTTSTGLWRFLDGPIDENEISFIGPGIKGGSCLFWIK